MFTVDLTTLAVPDVDQWQAQLTAEILASLPAVGEVLRESADSTFQNQADPWGNAWAETVRSAAGEGRILIDTGILRGSLHVELDTATMTVRVAAGGAAAAYAGVHQWGGRYIAARPFLALRGDANAPYVDLPADVQAEVVATVQDAIDRFVAQANASR